MSPDADLVVAFVEQCGLPVFPCRRNGKVPVTPDGFYSATSDPQQIHRWAQANPGCNWAVSTGAARLVVLDVDIKNGKAGDATLRALEAQHGRLPDTWQVLTPSGGMHYYFNAPPDPPIKSGTDKLGNGLDVKAAGGYVLIPPSEIDGKPYAFEASSDPAEVGRAELPTWLVELAADKSRSDPFTATNDVAGSVEWINNIAQGIALHDSLRDLAAHLAARGLRFEEMIALLESMMKASTAPRDERWRERVTEIPRLVDTAIRKFRGTALGPESAPDEWPEPVDFLRRPAAFPLAAEDSVPAISDYAMLFARAGGFCPSATILAGLAVCAAAIDDRVRLRLPVSSSWFESARLWVVSIGPPASGKTPALRAMASPLMELHRELFEQWQRECKEAEEQKEAKPKKPALYSSDATTEALADLLKSNPRGLLYACDEFESWIGSHDCYRGNGASRDRGEWLALYDGGPHQVDRVTRGSFFVPNWGCSILSATTPGALKKLAPRLPTDGLMQRFLPVIVAAMTKPDTSILHLQMKEPQDRYEGTVRRLYALPPATVQLGREARELFESELDRLRDATEAVEAVSESLSAHIAKHAAMLARVALAYHCIVANDHRADVEARPVRAAANLMRKLGRHAMAVYFDLISATAAPAVLIARDVARLLIAHTPECVRRRDLIQNVRAFRSTSLPNQDAAMQYLRDCAWLEPVSGVYDKGHSTMWTVNPKLAGKFAAQGAAERKRRAAVREMIHDEADVRSTLKC